MEGHFQCGIDDDFCIRDGDQRRTGLVENLNAGFGRRWTEAVDFNSGFQLTDPCIAVLSQAHAKLLWTKEVCARDVVVAVGIVKASKDGTLSANFGSTWAHHKASESLQSEIHLIRDIERVLGPSW